MKKIAILGLVAAVVLALELNRANGLVLAMAATRAMQMLGLTSLMLIIQFGIRTRTMANFLKRESRRAMATTGLRASLVSATPRCKHLVFRVNPRQICGIA